MSVVAGWVAVIVTLACPHSGPGRTAEEADVQSNQKKKNENGEWPTGSTGCNNDGGGSSSGVDNSDDNCSSSRRRIDDVVWW